MVRSLRSTASLPAASTCISTIPIPFWSTGRPSAVAWKRPGGPWPRTAWRSCCDGHAMKLMSADELEAALRDIGARRYHRLHPFHGLLHGGRCTRGQVQAWALNRYYYQASIPLKDASLIARCDDPALRREWRSRLVDHDGEAAEDGGIARWLRLTDGL